jgi:hypothetical protein
MRAYTVTDANLKNTETEILIFMRRVISWSFVIEFMTNSDKYKNKFNFLRIIQSKTSALEWGESLSVSRSGYIVTQGQEFRSLPWSWEGPRICHDASVGTPTFRFETVILEEFLSMNAIIAGRDGLDTEVSAYEFPFPLGQTTLFLRFLRLEGDWLPLPCVNSLFGKLAACCNHVASCYSCVSARHVI